MKKEFAVGALWRMNLLLISARAGALSVEQAISDKNLQFFQGCQEQEVHINTGLKSWAHGNLPLGSMLGIMKGSGSRTVGRIHRVCFLFLILGLSSGSSQKPERLAELKKQEKRQRGLNLGLKGIHLGHSASTRSQGLLHTLVVVEKGP